MPKKSIKKDLQNDPFVNISSDLLAQSEFIRPLPDNISQMYLDLWKEMRQS